MWIMIPVITWRDATQHTNDIYINSSIKHYDLMIEIPLQSEAIRILKEILVTYFPQRCFQSESSTKAKREADAWSANWLNEERKKPESRSEVNLYEMARLLKGHSITLLLHIHRVRALHSETQQSCKRVKRKGEEKLYISIMREKSASRFLCPKPEPLELALEIAFQIVFGVTLEQVWSF